MEFEEDLSIAGFKPNPLNNAIMRPSGKIQTSVLVSQEFFNLCKTNNIKFSEALRVGISILLADAGILEYDNNLNVMRKLNFFRKELEKTNLKIEELEKKELKE